MRDQPAGTPSPEDEDPDGAGDFAGPFCGTLEDCDHMLLVVDKTYRTAEGSSYAYFFCNSAAETAKAVKAFEGTG